MRTFPVTHPLDFGQGPNKEWNPIDDIEDMFPTFCDNLFISDEIIYSKKLRIFKDSKILLIGGGPSAQFTPLSNSDARRRYDYIWSMNNFFMCNRLPYVEIALLMFGANTQLSDPRLGDYLARYKPYMVFEPHPKYGFRKTIGHEKNPDWNNARKFINGGDYINNKAVCQTAFWSRVGIGARMLLLAGHLEVKQVAFIGIDGYTSYTTGAHYFEKTKGKEALPSSIQAMPDKTAKAVYLDEYKQLAIELNKFKGVTSYTNLGATFPGNDIGTMLDQ